MKKLLNVVCGVFLFGQIIGQCLPVANNMIHLDSWDNDNLYPSSEPTGHFSDCWGYATGGKEYGIIGGRDSIFIIDVTNPKDIFRVAGIYQGDTSVWRDFKVYGDYLYSIVDNGPNATKGVVIYDLSSLPVVSKVKELNSEFGRCHNIYIDVPNSRLYGVGLHSSLDICIYSLISEPNPSDPGNPFGPANPKLLVCQDLDLISPGSSNTLYIHDIFVRNNIAYCGHGYSGYYVWDVSDPLNIAELGSLPNTFFDNGYVHSSWNSDDNNFAVVATEVGPDPKLYWVDQSNPALMEIKDEYKDPRCVGYSASSTAPHNPYIKNDTIYVSDYADGVQILSINSTTNTLSKAAYYDTELINNSSTGYNGSWGVYPFLPSGTIIASDRRNGLFTLKYKVLNTYTFIGSGTDWNIAGNWEGGIVPPSGFAGIVVIAANCIKPDVTLLSDEALIDVKDGVTFTQY